MEREAVTKVTEVVETAEATKAVETAVEVTAKVATKVVWFIGRQKSTKNHQDCPFLFSYIELKREQLKK